MTLLIKTTGWEDYMDPAGGSWVKELILGNPDVGKTRSASFWPKPIFADCEDGRMSLADRKVPYGRIRTSGDMDALIRELQFDNRRPPEKRRYQTLILDTIDKFQKHLITEKLAREGKERLSGWADWGWLDGVMQSYIQQILNLEMNVIVNCHYKVVTSDTDDDSAAKALGQVLRLKGDVKEWLIEEFDLIGMMESYYATEDGKRARKRRIRWHNEPAFPLLKDRSGSLPQFTEVDFTDGDYTRVFEALMSGVDLLPSSATIDEIETYLGDEEPAPANLEGGPVNPGPLPVKKVAAKRAVAKKAPAAVRDAVPGEAVVTEPRVKGKRAEPVVVDANKANLENYSHAHAKDGTCLRNLWGPDCHAGETDSGAEGSGNPAPEKVDDAGVVKEESTSEASTDVPESGDAGAADPLPEATPEEAVANVAEALGGQPLDESQLPEKYCGKQPSSHAKFPKVDGCGKDLKDEIPAKINLALLRAKTMLCTSCFTDWKSAQEAQAANMTPAKN